MNLSNSHIEEMARHQRVEPEVVKAVIMVETPAPHVGDYQRDKPLILFERHKFYIFSGNFPVSREYPTLSNRKAGGYCSGSSWRARQECEHSKLQLASTIYGGQLRQAALLSVSMGLFQIMGFNYKLINQPSVEAMWLRYQVQNDELDLEDFFILCTNNKIIQVLRDKNFTRFAMLYNGTGYARNQYDLKLLKYYREFKAGKSLAQVDPMPATPTGFPYFSQDLQTS